MRWFSYTLWKAQLPKGLDVIDSVDEQGLFQTSISFPFAAVFSSKGIVFFDRVSKWIQRKEEVKA